MGNYKSRPSTSCSETWKNKISENYALVRRRLNEDLCHLKDHPRVAKRCEESCCSNQRAVIAKDPNRFDNFKLACINCDPVEIGKFVTHDYVNFRLDSDHFTPLHYLVISHSAAATSTAACSSSKENQISSIKLLISYGAKVTNVVTRNLFSPFHLAVFKSDPHIVSTILNHDSVTTQLNFVVNCPGSELLTPLHLACLHGCEEIVLLLLEKGADPNVIDSVKFSPMHITIYALNDQNKTCSIVKTLIDFGARFCYLHCPVGSKSSLNYKSVTELPNDEVDAEHIPILLLAASRRQVEVLDFLLKNHGGEVDVNTIDLEHNTALHVASKQGHVAVVKLLLQKSGIMLLENVYGDTPLHLACYNGKIEIAQLLIQKFGKSCLESVNVFGETPLHASCTFGHNLNLIEYILCENPELVNFQSNHAGHTPLHSCSYHGHFEAARLLVQNGADVTILANSKENGGILSGAAASEDSGRGTGTGTDSISLTSSENNSHGDCFTALYYNTCAQWAAENGHDDMANWLNQCRSNGDSSSYRSSTGGCTTESSGSYVPLPSKLGRIISVTQEKIGVLSLRAQLPKHMQIEYSDIEKLEHIGSGGFGKVYKSLLKSKNEIVAVKVYKHHNHSSKTDIDMFVREVKILWKLDNPYVIKFYGVCLDDASNFSIITEFCANGSLYHFIHKQKRCLDLPGKLVILQNVATGMNYLHTLPEPVIHRDLNSFNILLRESMNAVVADFGESRFIDRLLRQEMLTKQPGNLRWMSPEIFNQSTEYNTKADVFNFSLCIWELLSGELPFEKLTPLQAAQEMAVKGARPEISDSFPEGLVDLMTQCWCKEPNERPDFTTIVKKLNDLLMFNHVNTNLCNLSLHSPTSFVNGDISDGRISVAELRTNFENVSPNDFPTNSANSSRPNSCKSNDGGNMATLTRQLEDAAQSCSSEFDGNLSVTTTLGAFNTSTAAGGGTRMVPYESSPLMVMSNGYVIDTSQPKLLMAAAAAHRYNTINPYMPSNFPNQEDA